MSKRMPKRTKELLILFVALIVVALITAGFLLLHKDSKKPQQQTSNTNEVVDQTLGVSFSVGKDYERISAGELQKLNPNFIYGFRPKNTPDVSCIVSQTKRLQPGAISATLLAQGTFAEIKKQYPDALATFADTIKLGDTEGAYIVLTYIDGKTKMQQQEVVATNDLRTTFAFCKAPEPLINIYTDNFKAFLISLRIY